METQSDKVVKKLSKKRKKLIKLLPDYIKKDFKSEAYIAGGSIYSLYNGKPIKDIDVFIRSLDLKLKLLTYFKNIPKLNVKYEGSKTIRIGEYKGKRLVITDNAITIGEYQIILKDIGEPYEVVSRFDFLHNMHWIENGKLHAVDGKFNLATNKLQFNTLRARDIVSSIMRVKKFIDKGFELPEKELGLMLLKLNEVGFTDDELSLLRDEKSYVHFGS